MKLAINKSAMSIAKQTIVCFSENSCSIRRYCNLKDVRIKQHTQSLNDDVDIKIVVRSVHYPFKIGLCVRLLVTIPDAHGK